MSNPVVFVCVWNRFLVCYQKSPISVNIILFWMLDMRQSFSNEGFSKLPALLTWFWHFRWKRRNLKKRQKKSRSQRPLQTRLLWQEDSDRDSKGVLTYKHLRPSKFDGMMKDLTVIDTPWYTTFWSSSQWTRWRHTKVYVIAAIRSITTISYTISILVSSCCICVIRYILHKLPGEYSL